MLSCPPSLRLTDSGILSLPSCAGRVQRSRQQSCCGTGASAWLSRLPPPSLDPSRRAVAVHGNRMTLLMLPCCSRALEGCKYSSLARWRAPKHAARGARHDTCCLPFGSSHTNPCPSRKALPCLPSILVRLFALCSSCGTDPRQQGSRCQKIRHCTGGDITRGARRRAGEAWHEAGQGRRGAEKG